MARRKPRRITTGRLQSLRLLSTQLAITLRRKSRLNPFGINRPWKCVFHLHGWAAGPWELKTTRESAVAGYRGLLWPFKIRRMAAIVFQFRVVAGAL